MRTVKNINENWIFLKDATGIPAEIPEQAEKVSLPYTWNALDGQDGGNDYFRGKCCYIKEISGAEIREGNSCYLEIRGANSSAELYVNDRKQAEHDGGYSTWRVDFTDVLSENNQIALLVDNSPNDHVYPQTADGYGTIK